MGLVPQSFSYFESLLQYQSNLSARKSPCLDASPICGVEYAARNYAYNARRPKRRSESPADFFIAATFIRRTREKHLVQCNR